MAKKLSDEEQRQIGEAVSTARANQVSWKVLERIYGLGRTRLWMLKCAVESNKDVHEHPGRCAAA